MRAALHPTCDVLDTCIVYHCRVPVPAWGAGMECTSQWVLRLKRQAQRPWIYEMRRIPCEEGAAPRPPRHAHSHHQHHHRRLLSDKTLPH